jgi:predicted transcriptional regulator
MSAQDWNTKYQGGYVRMEIEKRREVVRELSAEGMTQRQIGDVLGVSHTTVSDDLHGRNLPKTNGQKRDSGRNPPTTGNASNPEDEKLAQTIRDESKQEQFRKANAIVLYRIVGQLAIKGTPESIAANLLNYDKQTLANMGLTLKEETWDKALETLRECKIQWKKQHHVCPGTRN